MLADQGYWFTVSVWLGYVSPASVPKPIARMYMLSELQQVSGGDVVYC